MKHKILLVEDNPILSASTSESLRRQGYDVYTVPDAETAQIKLVENAYDLILLDLMLPGIDGSDFLKELRKKSDLPIIITSAKNSEVDKAVNLEFGADDYITKPIATIELVARIKAVLRRTTNTTSRKSNILNHLDIKLNIESHEVYKHNQLVQLTAKEYDILRLFLENPNNVFSKKQIYTQIWQDDFYINENIINVHIRRLREKIETDPSNPQIIITIWGVGYKLSKNK